MNGFIIISWLSEVEGKWVIYACILLVELILLDTEELREYVVNMKLVLLNYFPTFQIRWPQAFNSSFKSRIVWDLDLPITSYYLN